jgi:hypothetical protein
MLDAMGITELVPWWAGDGLSGWARDDELTVPVIPPGPLCVSGNARGRRDQPQEQLQRNGWVEVEPPMLSSSCRSTLIESM